MPDYTDAEGDIDIRWASKYYANEQPEIVSETISESKSIIYGS